MTSIVGDILKRASAAAKDSFSTRAADVLVRMNLCRSKPLGKRDYHCSPCQRDQVVFNSCGERHCCRCSGFFRYRWLVKTKTILVPKTAYLQIVFTVPDTIGDLFQYAPAPAYAMLMQTAARETMRLQSELGITPGAIAVLHTWNQRLLTHAHVHVLIPVSGIAIKTNPNDEDQWISVADRTELAQGDQDELGVAFRTSIIRRIKRLQKHGKLAFTGKHEHLNDPAALTKHLSNIAPTGYRVFVQHAPDGCDDPATVVKYLARYVSGGPISDKRIVSAKNGKVTFLVRDNDSAAPGQPKRQVKITIPETEFVRRWALHILPKGFVRVRNFGHASHSSRSDYLDRCRKVLGIDGLELDGSGIDGSESDDLSFDPEFGDGINPLAEGVEDEDGFEIEVFGGISLDCPQCGRPMECVSFSYRPSWRDVMAGPDRPAWYES